MADPATTTTTSTTTSITSTNATVTSDTSKPTKQKYIQLGFAEDYDQEEDESPETFPSKIGGKPMWLVPENILKAEDLTCGRCGNILSFLLQIYAPLNSPSCYHRMVYVFCCRTNSCLLYKPFQSMVAFRAQLPRENKFYKEMPAVDEDGIPYTDYKPLQIARVCRLSGIDGSFRCGGCQSVFYCSQAFQKEDWNYGHSDECKALKKLKEKNDVAIYNDMLKQMQRATLNKFHKNSFREYIIATEPASSSQQSNPTPSATDDNNANNNDSDDTDDDEEIDEEKNKKLQEENRKIIEQYTKTLKKYEDEDFDDEDFKKLRRVEDNGDGEKKEVKDIFFNNFTSITKTQPNQILRYYEDPSNMPPLWVSAKKQPQPQDIPNCPQCNSPRICEFQILPQLLYFLKVGNDEEPIDWGVLSVYTCPNNCQNKENTSTSNSTYTKEFVWIQPI